MRLRILLAVALAALTIGVYAPARSFEFLNYDDNLYVVDNAHVQQGLGRDGIVWASRAFVNGNWHPVTMLSHMLDVSLFGHRASGPHVMNVVLHLANVLLLFWLLVSTTQQAWPSAFVAALFAVHPLNVQTVAWIAERKSLLSTAFWLLALITYASYRQTERRKGYLAAIVLAALALASKPMAVTLPLTLLLIDFWPLNRWPAGERPKLEATLREMLPFVAVSAACGVVTLFAQRAVHAVQGVATFTLPVRIGNALVAYAWYVRKAFWPSGLAAFYPHPTTGLSGLKVAGAAFVLVTIGAAVVAVGRRLPPLTMGWWWYVVTLLPVAGLIQVGSQSYADRYAYVPLIGMFIAIVWSAVRFCESRAAPWSRGLAIVGAVYIAAFAVAARGDLRHWHDSVALFERAIEVVPENALAENNLGMALVEQNEMDKALPHFQRAVELAPWDTDARSNFGSALRAVGRPADALLAYEKARLQAPRDASIPYNEAVALIDLGQIATALERLKDAIRLDPAYVKAHYLLGTTLAREGRLEEALPQLREVVKLDPQNERAKEWVREIEQRIGG